MEVAAVTGKDAYFFSHDSNARNDPKILAMRSVYGMQGYGWYWAIVEIMREQTNYKIPISKYTFDTLAMQLQCDRIKIEQYINDCCSEFQENGCSLLKKDDNYIWSESLLRRMAIVDKIREVNKQNAVARWHKRKESTKVKELDNDNNKGNDKKGKERKGQYTALPSLTDRNATAYSDRDYDILDLNSYYENHMDDYVNGNQSGIDDKLQLLQTNNEIPKWWIIEAIDESVDYKKPNFGYMYRILESWTKHGFKNGKLDKPKIKKGLPKRHPFKSAV